MLVVKVDFGVALILVVGENVKVVAMLAAAANFQMVEVYSEVG